MKTIHCRLTLFFVIATPSSVALWQCGSGDSSPRNAGSSSPIASPNDASGDRELADGEEAGSEGGDRTGGETADGDVADGSQAEDADASDGVRCDPNASPGGVGAGGSGQNATCGTGLTCCGGRCVDVAKDPRNCGACGNACGTTQFCTGTACVGTTIVNVCSNPKATAVLDPYSTDNSTANDIRTALGTWCSPPVAGMTFPETTASVQDPDSGRPLSGVGDTFIAGGGPFGQKGVGYMDTHGLTPVYIGEDSANAWYLNRKTGSFVVNTPLSSLTRQHDFLLIEVSVEPQSGTLCLFGIGMIYGTAAAGWYFNNVIMPNRAKYTDAWYVYEWTGASDAGTPGAGDTFRLIDHGM